MSHTPYYHVFDAVPEADIPSTPSTTIPRAHRHRRYGSSPYLSPHPNPTLHFPPSPEPSPPSHPSWSHFPHQDTHYTPHSSQRHHASSIPPPPQHYFHPQHRQHRQPQSPPTLRPPRCSICSSPRTSSSSDCNCEFTSLVIATEDAEAAILSPLFDEIRRVVTTRAKRRIQQEYLTRVQQAWITLQSRRRGSGYAGLGDVLQEDADRLWRECVQAYPLVLEREYKKIEEGMREGRGWRGEEAELEDGEERGAAEQRYTARGGTRNGNLRVYTE